MTPFLKQIAKAYLENYQGDLRECLFVFPSRRSSLFFQKYLGQCNGRPMFAPGITTIGELVSTLSPYRKGDRIELLYILYQKYSQVFDEAGEPHAGFDDFVGWGEALLADFNDVDKYLVDASRLFANISDLHQLDSGYEFLSDAQKEALQHFWGVVVEGEAEGSKKEFRHTWSFLNRIYQLFTAELRSRGLAYDGLMIRDLAAAIQDGRAEAFPERLPGIKRIVVVGQNALCEAEKVLLDYIRTDWDGDFYWDLAGEYLQDPGNKASHFIKDYLTRYPAQYPLEAEELPQPEIDVVSVSSGVAQAKVAAGYLEKFGEENTVVVLPDENLLLPLLHSIPESIRDINVTMGYGLAGSTVAALMHCLSSLQTGKMMKDGRWLFHHSDVSAIMALPFGAFSEVQEEIDAVADKIVKRNLLFIGQEEFTSPLLRLIFSPLDTAEEIQKWQMDVIEALSPQLGYVEREFAYGYFTAISRIRDLHIPMKPSTYFRFMSEMASRVKASFRGEPLAGLQIMGPLEVRAVDFDNVIILSVDEGVYPAKVNNDSFIPYNLRRAFGLPTAELFDSISSYHFYRSICRARNVALIYDSRTKGMLSGEESRFIKQLRYDYRHKVNVITADLKIEPVDRSPEVVEKTPELVERLKMKYIKGADHDLKSKTAKFSASTLMDYIACPLMFYYKHLEGLKEEEKVNEDVDAGMFGTAYHETMEEFYGQFKGQVVSKDALRAIIESEGFDNMIRTVVLRKMAAQLKVEVGALTGRNHITASLVQELVKVTLKRDAEMPADAEGFEYLDSERYMIMDFKVPVEGQDRNVLLHGFVDRLDAPFQTQYRICDYKTGSVYEVKDYYDYDAAISQMFSGEAKTSFQLLVYALLIKNDIDHNKLAARDIAVAVYNVRKQFGEMAQGTLCDGKLISGFEEGLRQLIAEIFSPEVPFEGRPGKPCKYCPAALICNR